MRFACALAIASLSVSAARAAPPQEAAGLLTLTFETAAAAGQVQVALFDSEGAYASGRPVRQAIVQAGSTPVAVVFRDLAEGEYAVRAFHDVDGDGQMKLNPFGIPLEPFAFSNNAPPEMGPASWQAARFVVSGDAAQTLRLR